MLVTIDLQLLKDSLKINHMLSLFTHLYMIINIQITTCIYIIYFPTRKGTHGQTCHV